MGTAFTEGAQEGTGRNPSRSFPGAPQQALFETPPTPWMVFLDWLARRDLKAFAARCYPDSEVDQAADNLDRILTGRHKRHFNIEWLDHLVALFGADAEREIVAFVCDRFGYAMPVRKPDPQREDERLERLEKTAQQLAGAADGILSEVLEIRRAREATKR